jgi:hypothetical protein
MTINQERFTTYKPLSPVLRTRTTSLFPCFPVSLVKGNASCYYDIQIIGKSEVRILIVG